MGELQELAAACKEDAEPKRRLLDLLDERYPFTAPKWLVDQEFRDIWRVIEADRRAGRLDAEDIGKSDHQLRREYRAIADRRVRLGLIISVIARRISFTSAPAPEIEEEIVNFVLGLAP